MLNNLKLPALASIFMLTFAGLNSVVAGELAVISNAKTAVEGISLEELNNIYMGQSRTFSSGEQAQPCHQDKGNQARKIFFQSVLKKSENRVSSYWSRRKFTGKGNPPEVVGDDDAVTDWVSQTPGGIGYINGQNLKKGVNVLLIIPY